ncbi:MAG: hypothetical protein FJX55_11445 [Alphaproteobacteria bacterium]|nr:hypothetical protein [Alphaproteobacteria bacterium]
MKVTIDIDCTPEEARAFLGLPDLRQAQEAMLVEVQKRMEQAVRSMDPETVMKTWLPTSLEGFEQMQKLWGQFGGMKGFEKK